MPTHDDDQVAAARGRQLHLLDRATGLPRWELLLDRLDVALAAVRRSGQLVPVFVVDDPRAFDGTAVDIAALALQFSEKLRPGDTVARIGARRIAIVCPGVSADEDAAGVARRILRDAGASCRLGISLGGRHDNADAVLRAALERAVEPVPAA
jgi:GGDEF domain-containing protein